MCATHKFWLIGVLLGVSILALGCGQEKKQPMPQPPRPGEMPIIPKPQPKQEVDPLKVLAVLETEKGTMEMEFMPQTPRTNKHIVELIQKRFYNLGMRFFRVDEDVVQTGDPTNTGYEGSTQTIELEVWDGQDFRVGSVGMARREDDPNSANSQFFICKRAIPEFNKDYTLFGQLVSGVDVLQKLEQGDRLIRITLKPKEETEQTAP